MPRKPLPREEWLVPSPAETATELYRRSPSGQRSEGLLRLEQSRRLPIASPGTGQHPNGGADLEQAIELGSLTRLFS